MYIRFVVPDIDDDSGREMGIFVAGRILEDSGELFGYERKVRELLLLWFSNNLEVPDVQASESNYYSKPNAISWFKSSATVHISKMREYAEILRAHDVPVRKLLTERPGKILYEDDYQVAAVPFKDTFK